MATLDSLLFPLWPVAGACHFAFLYDFIVLCQLGGSINLCFAGTPNLFLRHPIALLLFSAN